MVNIPKEIHIYTPEELDIMEKQQQKAREAIRKKTEDEDNPPQPFGQNPHYSLPGEPYSRTVEKG